MNKFYLSILFFFFLAHTKAQTPLTNYNFYNSFNNNPAMAGMDYKTQLTFTYGEQRNEQKGFLSYEASNEKLKSGMGFFVKSHRDRYRVTNHVGLAYNYTVHFSDLAKLTTGFQLSQVNLSAKPVDDSLKMREWWQAPNTDLGVVFSFEELKIGASLFHVFRPGILFENDSLDFYIPQLYDNRGVNLSISYNGKVSEYLEFQIAFFHHLERGRYKRNRVIDLSAFLTIYKYVTIGATYRSLESSDDNLNKLYLGLRPTKKILFNFSFNLKRPSSGVQYPMEVLAQYQF